MAPSARSATPMPILKRVVAIGQKKKEPDYRSLHIAANALTGCSSITFDKPRKRITIILRGTAEPAR